MRKLLMTIGVAALLAGSAQAADNYTCATPPSCASLGYTLTSTTNCVGTVLKCPFDTTKYYCTQKDEVFKNMQLDWANKKSLSLNSTYYVPKYGVIMGAVQDTQGVGAAITVNGNNYYVGNSPDIVIYVYIDVKPGDQVKLLSKSGGYGSFVPYQGN